MSNREWYSALQYLEHIRRVCLSYGWFFSMLLYCSRGPMLVVCKNRKQLLVMVSSRLTPKFLWIDLLEFLKKGGGMQDMGENCRSCTLVAINLSRGLCVLWVVSPKFDQTKLVTSTTAEEIRKLSFKINYSLKSICAPYWLLKATKVVSVDLIYCSYSTNYIILY